MGMMNKTVRHVSGLIVAALLSTALSNTAGAFGIPAPFGTKRDPASTTPTPTPAPTNGGSSTGSGSSSSYKAYWIGKNANAAQWTGFAQDAVAKYGDHLIKGASDISTFCPMYDRLGTQDRINFWVELLAAMTKYESGFNPASRMVETSMGNDPVTGAPTSSEGLLQLSYSDEKNYKSKVATGVCDFDYPTDRNYAVTDLRRTILNPDTNITCAVGILNYQVGKYGKIAVGSGAYWAVIKTDRASNKLTQIRAITNALSFCKN